MISYISESLLSWPTLFPIDNGGNSFEVLIREERLKDDL